MCWLVDVQIGKHELWGDVFSPLKAVRRGRHQLVIVLDENEADKNISDTSSQKLMQFAGFISAFDGVDGVEYQKKVRSEWN